MTKQSTSSQPTIVTLNAPSDLDHPDTSFVMASEFVQIPERVAIYETYQSRYDWLRDKKCMTLEEYCEALSSRTGMQYGENQLREVLGRS